MDKYCKNTTESGAWHFVEKRGELMRTKSKVFSRLVTKSLNLDLWMNNKVKIKSIFILLLKNII